MNVSTLIMIERKQSFTPLVNNTADHVLADHVPPTVSQLKPMFQIVNVLDLLTPAAEEHPRLSNPLNLDRARYLASLVAQRNDEHVYAGRCVSICAMAHRYGNGVPSHISKHTFLCTHVHFSNKIHNSHSHYHAIRKRLVQKHISNPSFLLHIWFPVQHLI